MCSRPRASRFKWQLNFKNAGTWIQKPWAGNLCSTVSEHYGHHWGREGRIQWEDVLCPGVARVKDQNFFHFLMAVHKMGCEVRKFPSFKMKTTITTVTASAESGPHRHCPRSCSGRAKSSFSLQISVQSSLGCEENPWDQGPRSGQHLAEWDVFPAQDFQIQEPVYILKSWSSAGNLSRIFTPASLFLNFHLSWPLSLKYYVAFDFRLQSIKYYRLFAGLESTVLVVLASIII